MKAFKIKLIIIAVMVMIPFSMVNAESVDQVTITSYSSGSMAYSFSAGISEAVNEVKGIRSRIIPGGNDFARVMPMREGEVEMTIFTGGTGFFVSRGAEDFSLEDWGPLPLRVAWRGADLYVGCYTQGNSDIKTVEDLKGKKTARIQGSPTINNINKGFVAFAGYDPEKDASYKSFPGHSDAASGLIDGAIDFYNFGTTGDKPLELASSPKGIRWINLDCDDDEAWDRLREYAPWPVPGKATRGAGLSEDNPVCTLKYPYNFWTLSDVSDEIVYEYAEGIWEGYEIYKDMHDELPYWDHEAAVDPTGNPVPFHDGLVQFFKDKGVWTEEMEEWQQKKVEREEARLELWDKAVEEAREKGIDFDSDEWKQMWWDKLQEKGLLKVYN
ncbi:MAG: TAXI family TRAP transporter solute-binding subunit [Bacteroidales bacterium]